MPIEARGLELCNLQPEGGSVHGQRLNEFLLEGHFTIAETEIATLMVKANSRLTIRDSQIGQLIIAGPGVVINMKNTQIVRLDALFEVFINGAKKQGINLPTIAA